MYDKLELIKELSNANGASGYESEVNQVLRKYGESFLSFKEDAMNNLRIYRKNHSNSKPILMLDAHSDEVSFMVKAILPNGTLKFVPLGGWHSQNVPAHKVRILNSSGDYIEGIIASKPPHFMTEEERRRLTPIDEMVIDIGALNDEQVRHDFNINVGAPIVPDVHFSFNHNNKMMLGKAFDCRLGCAAIVETFRKLKDLELPFNIVGSISSQEEVGSRGIKVNVATIQPDVAIAFEGSPADDTFRNEYEAQCVINKGPQIRLLDRLMISNPKFAKYAVKIATNKNIPYQVAVRIGGSTDAAVIHTHNGAIPCLVLGIPSRYAHTHYSFASLNDFENTVTLAVELIKTLDINKLIKDK